MWRRKIHGELRQCDAGVILLSKDALTSPWVLYETTVLTLHKDEWPEFDVIPVRLPGVTREDLAKGTFLPFALNEIQAAKGDTVEDIVDKIVERLALLKIILAEGPLQQFERTLSLWLKKDVDVLREAASKLGLDVEKWPQTERYSRVLLARELIKADGQRVLNALRVLTLHLNKDSLFGMITILTSLWVNEQAARLIPSVMKRPATQRAVSTNGRGRYTGRMYVLRACSEFPGWPVLRTIPVAGEDDEGEIVRQIREAYRRHIDDEEISNDDIDERLATLKEGVELYFVVINGYLRSETLANLQSKYPAVVFFLLTDDTPLDPEYQKVNYIQILLQHWTPSMKSRPTISTMMPGGSSIAVK